MWYNKQINNINWQIFFSTGHYQSPFCSAEGHWPDHGEWGQWPGEDLSGFQGEVSVFSQCVYYPSFIIKVCLSPKFLIGVYYYRLCYSISPFCQHLKPQFSWNDLKWRRQSLAAVTLPKKIHHTSMAWPQQPSYFKINPRQSPQPTGLKKKIDLSARVCYIRTKRFLFEWSFCLLLLLYQKSITR